MKNMTREARKLHNAMTKALNLAKSYGLPITNHHNITIAFTDDEISLLLAGLERVTEELGGGTS